MCKLDFSLVYVMGRVSLSMFGYGTTSGWFPHQHLTSAPVWYTIFSFFPGLRRNILPLFTFLQSGMRRRTELRSGRWRSGLSSLHLQHFLDFTNFYCRFIHYSQVAKPLTHLTSTKVPFCWTPEADATYTKPKHLFTTPLVLIHPDTSNRLSLR